MTLGLVAALLGSAWALPPLPPYIEQHYRDNPEYAKFAEVFKSLESKCETCHKPGADKKAKGHGLNDFGEAMHKHLKHRDFNAAHKLAKDNPAEAAKARKFVADALTKAEAQKNADGISFADLLKAGKMPGKN